jgi:hypothetical protein
VKVPEILIVETAPAVQPPPAQVADAGFTIDHLAPARAGRTPWEITLEMDEEATQPTPIDVARRALRPQVRPRSTAIAAARSAPNRRSDHDLQVLRDIYAGVAACARDPE